MFRLVSASSVSSSASSATRIRATIFNGYHVRFSSAMSPSLNDMSIDDNNDYYTTNNTSTSTNANITTKSSTNTKNNFMLILGKPGGGKGTISNKILKDFPTFKHLSTGDLLRKHVREESPIGLQAKKHMDNGDLVPDDIMIELVLHDATADNDNEQGLLLDGFPRTMEQAVALDESLEVDLVVDLNVPVDTIVERISDRWIHPGSGRIYNYSYNPPKTEGKDDITNEDLIQREDDKPETVRKRLQAYDKVTAPLIEYYDNKGILKSFAGTKSDEIYVEVQKWLEEKMETGKTEN